MNLEINITEGERTNTAYLSGEVDVYTATKLKEAITPLAEQADKDLIVDLSEVNYIDSTGLGIFIGTLKAAEKSDTLLRLTGLNDRVKRLFEITGLNEVIDIDSEKKEEA
ncbi:STAS domain-containing protein [Salipaludibacillus agaradhaerens]|uniref:STAS domain-containing protein n=1 Tax=Salipaludibacillus agaradhaerens TaxID=76935 RepID=UPI0021513F3E|nr:STAS domain-containing protein [Salipaludibacillus agaradhaerens]MCR6105352.1 STAS domain-containing protein [Salipaludibacillus agaradhaerens]MCR6117393.1 STAS domain-containing protein [Salipaludibacillus agaradhaerens]UJW56584.1 STAS domain-containing protein [Bacillus sp. A116_S68]